MIYNFFYGMAPVGITLLHPEFAKHYKTNAFVMMLLPEFAKHYKTTAFVIFWIMGSEHGVGWRAKWSDLDLKKKVKINNVFDVFHMVFDGVAGCDFHGTITPYHQYTIYQYTISVHSISTQYQYTVSVHGIRTQYQYT